MEAGLGNGAGSGNDSGQTNREETQGTLGWMSEQGAKFGSKLIGLGSKAIRMNHTLSYVRGISFLDAFKRSGELRDIEAAIEVLSDALKSTPEGHKGLPRRHAALGDSYTSRYRRLGQLDDLEKAIEQGSRALALTSDGHPDLPIRHASLGVAYSDRYGRLGQHEDLEKSIEHNSRALMLTPDDHPGLSVRHANLGDSYGDRYRRLGELKDLEISIKHLSRALALTPDGQPDLPNRHADLGTHYSDRYRRLGELKDLEKSAEHKSRALALTPDGHPDLPARHAAVAVAHTDRFQRLGQFDDLEKSIEHSSRAFTLTPEGHPDLARRHAELAAPYYNRYHRLGQLDDLEKSIGHYSRALALTPDGHPDLSVRNVNLGVSYVERFRRLDQLEDLKKSAEYLSRGLALTPEDHPDMPQRYTALGESYADLYRRLGDLNDIEKSIEFHARAITLTPDGHPDLSVRHANLGGAYNGRYQRLGELNDLEKSIENMSRALELTPDGHPDLSMRHSDIGISYAERSRRLGQSDDLERAIDQFTRALALAPEDHPRLLSQHTVLGMSYNDRYRRSGQFDDLEKSIEHLSRALALAPDGHPAFPRLHAELGVPYRDRYHRLGKPDDLEKLSKHYSQALALTPDDHPDLPSRHFAQADSFMLQYQYTGDSSYLNLALVSFRNASQPLTGSPRPKFQHALYWANLASKQSSLNPIEAYQTAISLLPQFIWLGATAQQRYQDLSTAENLAVNAASVAIHHSDHQLALEWLEHARCVVWNQTLMLRSPIEELQSSHPDLATRLQVVTQQLDEASSVSLTSQTLISDSEGSEQIGQQRRRLAMEYNDIIAQARTLPGFDDFLQPMKAGQLLRAARYGPIVVINCQQDRCDSLLILPGQTDIQHLPLPKFTHHKAQIARSDLENSLRQKGLRERGFKVKQEGKPEDKVPSVLLTLWNDVIKPVLDFLGYMNTVSTDGLPHITWCPTGALSFLPLHAAGDYDKPGSRVFDYAISSYIPTLTSVFASNPTALERTPRVLAIGQEYTPNHSPLPGTTKELEHISAHTQGKVEYSELTGSQATTTAVLDAMEQYDWVHLACHAHQNVADPTKSGFFLQDGTLDLATINRRSLKNKGLAFLSACQTATGDEKLPDEAIHLASGMLTAGYPSVIATMWSVNDSDAPLIADKVYGRLMTDGKVGSGEAGKALHYAVAELRGEIGEKQFMRWLPYIHIGS